MRMPAISEWADHAEGARLAGESVSDRLTMRQGYLDRCRSWISILPEWLTRALWHFAKATGEADLQIR